MSRVTQSRAQTEANAKILRSLVKSADNKVCVDCKKNDPRWASWNLGCFLCIRCSGIHRSMGTHISKVKSIDLDIWTPEQMESVQKWGNRRCNLYWEAHLKAGHVPADHKIESFIRSKYESRRWAKDGPPPSDPAVLDGERGSASAPPAAAAAGSASASASAVAKKSSAPPAAAAVDLLDDPSPAPSPAAPAASTKQSASTSTSNTAASSKPSGGGGIFDLDWHDPSPTSPSATSPTTTSTSSSTGGAKGKNDIMSLFAAKPSIQQPIPNSTSNAFGDFGSFASAPLPTNTNTNTNTSIGTSSGMTGLNSTFGTLDLSGGASKTSTSAGNPWSTPSNTTSTGTNGGLFDTQDVWGTSNPTTTTTTTNAIKKDDAFADIWGDFK
ncbi:related to AGE2 - ADP-ribosylation factor and GTPase activating protein effector [Ustilago trichophora]|uniref:Related to AGE2 - ADP-ribosylation factor and GTPase activating protein effector n=1 Tax=Ustilago trichophora TaxID=86804 RepID=A0A5C3E7D1_9BASI|nr:related to AGE2 - ADP-ribosylation factor and GTPase activating protein effector [Ustilago trichophora]